MAVHVRNVRLRCRAVDTRACATLEALCGLRVLLLIQQCVCSVDIGKSVANALGMSLRSQRRRLTPLLAAGAGAGESASLCCHMLKQCGSTCITIALLLTCSEML